MTQTIFVFEELCGGGMIDQDLPDELVAQGFAMLAASIEDFIDAGCRVLTILDHRVPLSLDGLEVYTVNKRSQLDPGFNRLASRADATLVIAPEFDHLLEKWLRRLEELGAHSLGCMPEAAALCGDKLELAQRLESMSVPMVKTFPLDQHKSLEPPVIIKPRYGVGCQDTFCCGDRATLDEMVMRCLGGGTDVNGAPEWIIQPWRPGVAVSVSFIVHEDKIMDLPAGRQFVTGQSQLRYDGGDVPLDLAVDLTLDDRARRLGRRAIESVLGLRGFVGVDLVLDSVQDAGADSPVDADVVIEINPRLTVSYCGLRAMCKNNLAAAMLDSSAPLQWFDRVVRFDSSGRVHKEAIS